MLAKRSAAVKACELLYKRHQLNEKLFPVPQHVTPIINAFMDSVAVEKESERDGEGKVGSKKRTQWYRKRVSILFISTDDIDSYSCAFQF